MSLSRRVSSYMHKCRINTNKPNSSPCECAPCHSPCSMLVINCRHNTALMALTGNQDSFDRMFWCWGWEKKFILIFKIQMSSLIFFWLWKQYMLIHKHGIAACMLLSNWLASFSSTRSTFFNVKISFLSSLFKWLHELHCMNVAFCLVITSLSL